MRYLWRAERRHPTARAALLALFVLAPATPARAHGVTASIAPPPTPVVEDSGFPIVFTGGATALGEGGGYIRARIRPVGGPRCAPTEGDDPGARVDFGGAFADSIDGPFRSTGSYVADEPRDYVREAVGGSTRHGRVSATPRRASATRTAPR